MNIQVDTVGMSLDDAARAQLQCIATTTGGTYYDAGSTAELTNSLGRITQRAVRDYDFQGTPIRGGASAAAAAPMGVGQWLDSYAGEEGKWYRVPVPAGRSVFISATQKAQAEGSNTAYTRIVTYDAAKGTGEDARCGFAQSGYAQRLFVVGVAHDPLRTGRADFRTEGCEHARELLVHVERVNFPADDPAAPVELTVSERPWLALPMTSPSSSREAAPYAGLPAPRDRDDKNFPMPTPTAPTSAVVGGTSLNSAAELKPGSYRESVQLGETLVYRVKQDWGQSSTLLVDSDEPHQAFVEVQVVGPQRGLLSPPWEADAASLDTVDKVGRGGKAVGGYAPPVRLNNIFSSWTKLNAVAEPGYVYYVVSFNDGLTDHPKGQPYGVRLSLSVDGRAGEGAPPTDAPTGVPAATPSGTASGAGTPVSATPARGAAPGATTEPPPSPSEPSGSAPGGPVRALVLGLAAASGCALVGGGLWWWRRGR